METKCGDCGVAIPEFWRRCLTCDRAAEVRRVEAVIGACEHCAKPVTRRDSDEDVRASGGVAHGGCAANAAAHERGIQARERADRGF